MAEVSRMVPSPHSRNGNAPLSGHKVGELGDDRVARRDERLERINRLDPYGGVGIISIAHTRALRKSFALFPNEG